MPVFGAVAPEGRGQDNRFLFLKFFIWLCCELKPDFSCSLQLHIMSSDLAVVVFSSLAVKQERIAERLGICIQINFVRFLLNLPLAGEESKLFIRNGMFEHVPGRIYQPKSPSNGLRRGLLYLHEGYSIFGSISKLFQMSRTFPLS